MKYFVEVNGSLNSTGKQFKSRFEVDALSEEEAQSFVEEHYDWSDATHAVFTVTSA